MLSVSQPTYFCAESTITSSIVAANVECSMLVREISGSTFHYRTEFNIIVKQFRVDLLDVKQMHKINYDDSEK